MTLVKAYEMSLLATIFFDLWASYASLEGLIGGRNATVNFGTYQKEAEDNTSDKQPPPNIEGDCHAVLGRWAVVEDLVRPLLGGQHGDGRKDIQDVDKEVLKHDNIEPHVPRGEKNWGVSERLAGVGLSNAGGTHLDRMPHELSVNSLVSTKSNYRHGRRVSARESQGGEYRGCMHLVVGNLFTFPPRTATTHG